MKHLCALLAALCVLFPFSAPADGWYVFPAEDPPEALLEEAMQVGGTGTVTLSFLGDCTLGGEGGTPDYVRVIRREGPEWPFGGLAEQLSADDITLVNLEGVLTDRTLSRVPKTFNFKGPSSMTQVLTAGSVECVTLANNHSLDYGAAGLSDTKKHLSGAGLAYTDQDTVAVWCREGILIGFTSTAFTPGAKGERRLEDQIAALKKLGCCAVVHSMHAGQEYILPPAAQQTETAAAALKYGASLVIGHHPHVVQGAEAAAEGLILYSLGNASFGGNTSPSDTDALLAVCTMNVEEGELTDMVLSLHPVSSSGTARRNDYRPVLLRGEDAQRVFEKMERSTGFLLPGSDDPDTRVLTWSVKGE